MGWHSMKETDGEGGTKVKPVDSLRVPEEGRAAAVRSRGVSTQIQLRREKQQALGSLKQMCLQCSLCHRAVREVGGLPLSWEPGGSIRNGAVSWEVMIQVELRNLVSPGERHNVFKSSFIFTDRLGNILLF